MPNQKATELLGRIQKARTKQQARAVAQDWQAWQSGEALSFSEYVFWSQQFFRLGKKHGLLREFRENGIL